MISTFSSELMFVVYIGLFLGVLLIFEGIRQLISRAESVDQARNRRMKMIKKGTDTEDILSILLDDSKKPGQRRDAIASLRHSLHQSGLPLTLSGLFLIMVLVGSLTFAFSFSTFDLLFALPLSIAAAIFLPISVLTLVRRTRLQKLNTQLPDALDLMSRGLTVGHPLNVTVASVASEMPDPIGTEFGIVLDQVSYGDDIVTAFSGFADRVELEDVRYLAVSVGIQHGTGGNLSRVLQVLSKVTRDRAMMRKKIRAISSEGRLSAMILTALPFAMFLGISVTTPEYYGSVRDDPAFIPIAAIILSLIVLQGIILNRMVSFKF